MSYEISQLTVQPATAPASNDMLVTVDVSDTSTPPAGPAGSNKSLTLGKLLGAARARYSTNFVSFCPDDFGADPTGASDSTSAFVSAASAATNAVTNGAPQGLVTTGMGQYKVSGGNISVSGQVGFVGPGAGACTILAQGAGAVFARSMTSSPSSYGELAPMSGMTIDGSGMGSSAGFGVQDTDCGHALYSDLYFTNFTASTSAGLVQLNQTYWSEQVLGYRLWFNNCTIGHLQNGQTSPGPASFDYSDFFGVHYNTFPGQTGRVLTAGPAVGGSYRAHVNAHVSSGSPSTVWTVGTSSGDTASISSCAVDLVGEVDGAGSTAYDFAVGASAGLFLTGVVRFPGFTSNPSGGSGVLVGNISSPTFNRPIYTAVPTGAGPGATFGAWERNTFGYALQLPLSSGSPSGVPTIATCVGAPADAAPLGSVRVRQDTPGTSLQQLYVCTTANVAAASSWTPAAISGQYLVTPNVYAPGTLTSKTTTGTAFAAVDSTNIQTGSFTAPPSGSVEVIASFVHSNSGNNHNFFALAAHGTVTPLVAFSQGELSASASGGHSGTARFIVTGLTAGTSYNFDLLWATDAGTATMSALGATATTPSGSGAPVIMTVQAI